MQRKQIALSKNKLESNRHTGILETIKIAQEQI